MKEKKHIRNLDLAQFEKGKVHKVWLDIISDPFGMPITLPLLIRKGTDDGPVLGLTAAVHGNELNGIHVIQRLFKEIADQKLRGTVIGVPVVNYPSFIRKMRRFPDGVDLNHIMPGKENSNSSSVYAYRFFNSIVRNFDYLIDLHTASTGRENSYYIRADKSDEMAWELARLQNASIIVDNPPSDGTLRGAADEVGIPAITLEVGNPNTFQRGMIRSGITGLYNAMIHLGMIDGEIELNEIKPVLCKKSYWIYTSLGGLLYINPKITEIVEKDQLIASQYDIFGDKIKEYFAPERAIIIGRSVNPVNDTGGRIAHLGIIED